MAKVSAGKKPGIRKFATGALVAALLCVLAPILAFSATFTTESMTISGAGATHAFTVEIAALPDQRAQGLMNRKEMAADRGMLFDFGTSRRVYMWMKDTYLPLDMLFLKQDGTIVSIAPDTVPLSEAIIDSHQDVRFVIELNAGMARKLGIAVGDRADSARIKAAKP